jgi:hypothetical protein
MSQSESVSEHRAAFMETLRAGRQMRTRVFNTLEQRHAQDFGNRRVGSKLYEDLLSAVREAGVPEAVEEFQSRFFPLLTTKAQMTAADDRGRGRWGWIAGVCVAVVLGAVILGFNTLRITAAKPPAVTEVAIPAAGATAPAPETTNQEGSPLPAAGVAAPSPKTTNQEVPPLAKPTVPYSE